MKLAKGGNMDELRLRRIFLGLLQGSLLLSAAGCGGTTGQDPLLGGQSQDTTGGSGGDDGGLGGTTPAPYGGTGGTTAVPASNGGTGGTGQPQAEAFWSDLDITEFATPDCEEMRWRALSGLNPQASVDYAALRLKDTYEPPAGLPEHLNPRTELDAQGTACATASDASACESAMAQAIAGVELHQQCGGPPLACQHFLLTTAGDHVEVTSPEELVQFLGPIDTPQEALLRVFQGTFMGYSITCDRPDNTSVRAVSDGYQVVATRMSSDCNPVTHSRNLLHVAADGSVTQLRSQVAAVTLGCVGRRPEGLLARAEASEAQLLLGEFFAGISHLEAASVTAFERLRAELEALGAPVALQDRALRSARDEVRHAAQTRLWAERFGGQVTLPVVPALELRDLERVACENVAEGCVRETYGALVAHHQAEHASHPEIRSMMRAIAEDETRHAALAWSVAAWAEPRLSSAARARVREALRSALAQLRSELATEVPEELREVAGVPSAAAALELFAGLERSLWRQGEPGYDAALS
jgi:hypothetical protein